MNKQLLVLALICTLAFSNIVYSDDEIYQMWGEWKSFNNKRYGEPEVEYFRFDAFKANLYIAQELNAENPEATFGMTQFADLTSEEFVETYLGFDQPMNEESSHEEYDEVVRDSPASWDWTTKGAVTAVKNQGQCGSCWAFSTTGNLEGQNFLKHSNLVSLSEQQLVDCDTVDQGCNGGLMDNAFKWLQDNGGLMGEDDYPYKGVQQTCKFDESKAVVQVTGFTDIAKGDEKAMVDSLYSAGPISIAIHANGLQMYAGGIFNPVYCSKQLNHGVLGVGYGTDGKDFWKIKNSWGESWGEKGYFRIIRGKNMCGLANAVSTATVA